MAVDSRGAKGQPIFLGTSAPASDADLTLLGEEIYERGNYLVVSGAERDALTTAGYAYDGLSVYNTTAGRKETRLDGAWKTGVLSNIQRNTTNTEEAVITQYGFGKVKGVAARQTNVAVTFPAAFAGIPNVQITAIGGQSSSAFNLATLGVVRDAMWSAVEPVTTGFRAEVWGPSGNLNASLDYYFSWTATGPTA